MTDFFESFSDEIEENAGAYAALGGLAVLKGQQAQRKKLSDIEEELKRAKTEAQKIAQLKRKLVICEEEIDIILDSANNKEVCPLLTDINFSEKLGKPSELLSEIEDIKYARAVERKADAVDKLINVFLKKASIILKANNLYLDEFIEQNSFDEILKAYDTRFRECFNAENIESLSKDSNIRLDLQNLLNIILLRYGQVRIRRILNQLSGHFNHVNSPYRPIRISGKKSGGTYSRYIFIDKNNFKMLSDEFLFSAEFRSELLELSRLRGSSIQLEDILNFVSNSNYFKFCFSEDYIVTVKPVDLAERYSNPGKYSNNKRYEKSGDLADKYNNSNCFVATAVYGDHNHPQVQKLRNFRDAKLNKTEAGRYFVKFYYAVGPKLALLPRSSKLTKRVLRHILDRF